jgi:hypothetical protein
MRAVLLCFAFALAAPTAVAGCGTLASPAGGDVDLPNAGAGPFRLLKKGEIAERVAPYVAEDDRKRWRDPWALDVDGDPSTLGVELYVVGGPDDAPVVARFDAADGRSTARSPVQILAADAAPSWEGGVVARPSVVRVGGARWLYYGAAGGIGLARADGPDAPFVKETSPVLDASGAAGWEAGAVPRQPSVWRLPDGSYRMLYAVPAGIGEAASRDGVAWSRIGAGPLLVAAAAPLAPPVDGGLDEPFDDVEVAAPCAVRGETAEGRAVTWVYYAGKNRIGTSAIGLAARFGDEGGLTRAIGPVLASNLAPGAASVVRFASFSLLYVQMRAGSSPAQAYPAVAAGVAPATVSLAIP